MFIWGLQLTVVLKPVYRTANSSTKIKLNADFMYTDEFWRFHNFHHMYAKPSLSYVMAAKRMFSFLQISAMKIEKICFLFFSWWAIHFKNPFIKVKKSLLFFFSCVVIVFSDLCFWNYFQPFQNSLR